MKTTPAPLNHLKYLTTLSSITSYIIYLPCRNGGGGGSPNTVTRCRITVNDHETPADHRLVAMQYVSRQITVLSSETLLNHRVHVTHCNDASIYLLSSMRNTSVKQCARSTVVTGPVAGTLYLTGCINMRIITIARRVVLRLVEVGFGGQLNVLLTTRCFQSGNH